MPRHDVILRHGRRYAVYAPDEVVLGDEIRCPECNSNQHHVQGTPMEQTGLFEDIMWEFITCDGCKKAFCIRDVIDKSGSQSYLSMIDDLLDEMSSHNGF